MLMAAGRIGKIGMVGSDAGIPSPPIPDQTYATSLDGINDHLVSSAGMGLVDGPSGTILMWIKMNAGDGTTVRLFGVQSEIGTGGSGINLKRENDGKVSLTLKNAGGSTRLQCESTWTLAVADGWCAVMLDYTTAGTISMYKGDTAGHTVTTNVAGDIDYSADNWTIAARSDGNFVTPACYSNVLFNPTRLGLETEANRRPYYTAGGGAVYPGKDGSGVFGSASTVALTNPFSTFHLNNGSGNDYAVVGGPLVACGDLPPPP